MANTSVRRERRRRQFLRHERLSVAMALAESNHHAAPWGQKMARAGEEGTSCTTRPSSGRPPLSSRSSSWESPAGSRPRLSLRGVRKRYVRSRPGVRTSTFSTRVVRCGETDTIHEAVGYVHGGYLHDGCAWAVAVWPLICHAVLAWEAVVLSVRCTTSCAERECAAHDEFQTA